MLPWTIIKCVLVTLLVLLSVAGPTEAFSLFDLVFGSTVDKIRDDTNGVLKTTSTYVFGGGTAIVSDAIKLNFLDIGPTLREWLGVALKNGAFALIEGAFYIVWNIAYYIVVGVGYLVWGIVSLKHDGFWKGMEIIVPIIIGGGGGGGNATSFFDFDIQDIFNQDIFNQNIFNINANKDNILSARSINVLRGRREAGPHFDSLEDTLTKAPLQDHLECLPLVLCAIYAEPEAFTSPLESKFRYAFRSVFTKGAEPKWVSKYIQAADEGETLKSSASCQSSYSSCPYSPDRLRRLIFQTLDTYWLDYNNEVKT